jgi:hypothetical protein
MFRSFPGEMWAADAGAAPLVAPAVAEVGGLEVLH